jgi:hypothetical protein
MPSITFDLNKMSEVLDYLIENRGKGYVLNNSKFADEDLLWKIIDNLEDEFNENQWFHLDQTPAQKEYQQKLENTKKTLEDIAETMGWKRSYYEDD